MRYRADAVRNQLRGVSGAPWIISMLLAASGLGIIILLGTAWLGSVENVVRAIRGAPAVVLHRVTDLGVLPVGTSATATFTICNLRPSILRVAGASADCGCVAGPKLPQVIDALGTVALPVSLHVEKIGASEVHVVWFVEDATESSLPCSLRYTGVR